MWHVYAYVPAVANVLVTDTFALLPPMSVGAPACCVKNTLCATEPKANVTTSPTFTVSVAGVNARDGVAATVLAGGGGGGGGGGGRGAGVPEALVPPGAPKTPAGRGGASRVSGGHKCVSVFSARGHTTEGPPPALG